MLGESEAWEATGSIHFPYENETEMQKAWYH